MERSRKVLSTSPSRALLVRYYLYLKKGKYKEGHPFSLQAFTQHFFPNIQLASEIQLPICILCLLYKCKLNLSMQQRHPMYNYLLCPITPDTVAHVIRPHTCDPCARLKATETLNAVRKEFVKRYNEQFNTHLC